MSLPPALERLRGRLATADAPGPVAKGRMAPSPLPPGRLRPPAGHRPRQAAVLLLLREAGDGLSLPLIVRPRVEGDAHSGQISFPGGQREGDETAAQTALREAQEEIGVDPGAVELLGRLSDHWIPVSDFVVRPVVGFTGRRPDYRPEPGEVERIFEQPLAPLHGEELESCFVRRVGERELSFPCWDLPEGRLWGATAMMLAELLALLSPPVR